MIGTVITVLAFFAGFCVIFAANMIVSDLLMRERAELRKRMESQLVQRQKDRVRGALSGKNFDQLAAEALRENQEPKSLWDWLQELVEQSGTGWSAGKLAAVCCVAGAAFSIAAGVATGSALVGGFAGMLVAPLPVLYIEWQRRRRLEALRSQLPDSLELMSRILRAGQTITQGMQAVATEFPRPIADEFGYCYEQQNLGLSQEVALRDLAKRTGLLEVRIFVLGLLVHRRSGGNLTELLDNVAALIRERFKLRGKIKALTAEGRFQAMALLILPVFAFVMLVVVNREYAMKLLNHPWLIVVSLVSMTIGSVWIHRIVNFDF